MNTTLMSDPALYTVLTVVLFFALGWAFGEVRDRMQEWNRDE